MPPIRRILKLAAVSLATGLVAGGGVAEESSAEAPSDRSAAEERLAEEPTEPAARDRTTRLQGSAFLGRNRFVVGASVLVTRTDAASGLFLTTSDERGRFRVDDLEDGSYRVEVRREGLQPVVKDGIRLRYPFRAVVELPMEPQGDSKPAPDKPVSVSSGASVDVRGRVALVGAGPLAEIRLRWLRPDGEVDPLEVRSDPDGRFRLDGLPAGRWKLEATGVGLLPMRSELEIATETELVVSMIRQPANYRPSPLDLMPEELPGIPPGGFELDLTPFAADPDAGEESD